MNKSNISPQYLAWVRFRKNKGSLAGLFILLIIILAISVGPFLYDVDPNHADLKNVLAPPSKEFPLGADEVGRDILSRILYGGRLSILIGLIVVLLSLIIGTAFGMLGGFLGNRTDQVIVYITDITMAFPAFLLALLMIAILGPGLGQAMIAIGIAETPRFIRIARASTLTIKNIEYVEASRALGQSSVQILLRHIFPNILGPIVVQGTLLIGVAILWAAALGFLGLGVQPPTSEWGNMLSNARNYIRIAPYVGIFPGLAIMITVLTFNMIGDGVRSAVDVRQS